MAVYNPPSANLPEFDTAVFEPSDVALTYSLAKKYFLTYPVAQGSETLQKVGQVIGLNNIQFGDLQTFDANTTGQNNVAIGQNILRLATTQNNTICIGVGSMTGAMTGTQNVVVGNGCWTNNTVGSSTVLVGHEAGGISTNLTTATYIGKRAGYRTLSSQYCTCIGADSGPSVGTNYGYLTCIGGNSGNITNDPVGSNRVLIGSAAGNEDTYICGTGNLKTRVSTGTIAIYDTLTSGTLNIATGMAGSSTLNIGTNITGASTNINIGTSLDTGSTMRISKNTNTNNGVYMNGFRIYKQASTICSIAPETAGDNMMLRCNGTSGNFRILDDSNTANNIIIGPNGGTYTGTIEIARSSSTGNVAIHNGNASGNGRVVINRNIVLPTSTTFATPAAGELGYSTTRTATLTSTTTFTGTTTAINSTIGEIASMTFPSVGVFNVYVRVRWTRTGSNNAIAGRLGLSTANNTITDQAGSVGNYYWTGSLWNTTPAAMDYMGVFTQVVTNSSTTYYLTGQFCFSTGTDTLVADDVSFFVTRIA